MKEESKERKLVVEQGKRFSESMLWKLQREYFEKEGINAWVNQVPFYITSNPFIASCYAKVFVAFVRGWIEKHPDAKNHPFYLMELGTGSGRFSFYFVRTVTELLERMGLGDIKICYIMSDFTKHNMQYWETQPALKPFVEKGLIDFALYDMEVEKPIKLARQNIQLTPDVFKNPLTVFANYIFDTVSHDSFTVHEGRLFELLVSLSTEESNVDGVRPKDMEKVTVDHSIHEIRSPNYYNDPHLDAILEIYKTSLKDTSLLLPIGSIKAIKLLKKLTNDKLMIISTDKGYGTLENLDGLGHPSIAFHGSFSMMVNFHAISEYFKRTGGDAYLQTTRKGIRTSVFSAGFKLSEFSELMLAIEQHVEEFSPSDYFTLHRRISDTYENCDLDTIASHLTLSEWDPHIYNRISSRVTTLVPEADRDTIIYLAEKMPKIAANYYQMPKSDCVLFEIAVFYHACKQYENALKYYQEALAIVGEQFGLIYNIALCQHMLGLNQDALKSFQHAVELNADSTESKEWVAFIQNALAEESKPKE